MTNKTTNTPPFKVKCTDIEGQYTLTVGKEYDVIEAGGGFYKVINDAGNTVWYEDSRFEIVKTPKDKQEFSVGDKVVISIISDEYLLFADINVKVGDVATVIEVGKCFVKLSHPNWLYDWAFKKTDVSLVEDDKSQDYHILTHQEVIQATIDGKEVEIQYTDGTWHSFSTHSTTLHQFINLNFRLKPSPSLEDKRKAVIKKLLETKVAVLCKCWDDDVDYIGKVFVAVTSVDDGYTYPYTNNELTYQYAFAIDDNGNEITNV